MRFLIKFNGMYLTDYDFDNLDFKWSYHKIDSLLLSEKKALAFCKQMFSLSGNLPTMIMA